MDDMKVNTKAITSHSRGIGIALSFVLTSQIYPFMLSSAFTARTLVQSTNQVPEVQTDLNWALGLSIASAALIGYFMGQDWMITLIGGLFGVALYCIYIYRGNLPLPWETLPATT